MLSPETKFIVTGSTGQLGRRIVHRLLERVPAQRVIATCRSPENGGGLRQLGVAVRHADYGEAESLRSAFDGGGVLLLVSSNAARFGADPVAQHAAVIEAARQAGVERVVYTSHMGACDTSAFPPMLHHHATETLLRGSGLRWTALRNGFYTASGLVFLGEAMKTGVFRAPADGKVSWTTHEELAEAAVTILVRGGDANGPTRPLAATEALNLAELASKTAGRSVTRVEVSDAQYRAEMLERGTPAAAVDLVMGFYEASRRGAFEARDSCLAELLGRSG